MPSFSKLHHQGYSFKESFNYYLRSQGKAFCCVFIQTKQIWKKKKWLQSGLKAWLVS